MLRDLCKLSQFSSKFLLHEGARATSSWPPSGETGDGWHSEENVIFTQARVVSLHLYFSGVPYAARPKYAIQSIMLRNMLARDGDPLHCAIWLMSYIWLLRMPSEVRATLFAFARMYLPPGKAMPVCICAAEPPDGTYKSAIWREEDIVCLKLSSRKNMPQGSGILRRRCSCKGAPKVCPVHVLWDCYLSNFNVGTMPWAKFSSATMLSWIRAVLQQLAVGIYLHRLRPNIWTVRMLGQVPNAGAYGTHAFRRGHARVC